MKYRFDLKVVLIVLSLLVICFYTQSVHATDWSLDLRLTWDPKADFHPSVTNTTGGKIWVVWHSYRIDPDAEIFYKIYDPAKVNPWSLDTRLTFSDGSDIDPSIMQAADGLIWVIWATNRTGDYEVYYKTYDGAFWSDDTIIPLLAEPKVQYPSILQTQDGTIWVFSTSNRTGNREIFYKTSADNGASWSDDTLLLAISSSADDWDPYATRLADGNIWLVWTRNDDIYYTVYNGASWSAASPVTTNLDFDAHPAAVQTTDGNIQIFWDSDRASAQFDVYYNVFNEAGTKVVDDTALTSDLDADIMSSVTRTQDGTLLVAWSSNRLSNIDIYYKTATLSPPHDVAIFAVAPSEDVVAQGRNTSIEVVPQNLGTTTESFSVSLYANSTLLGTRQVVDLIPGQLSPLSFTWDTTGVALGSYTIKANATVVTGETNVADNTFLYDSVQVVVHDIAVISVTASINYGYREYIGTVTVFVTVKNEGTISEDFTVIAYYNSTDIASQAVSIEPGGVNVLLYFLDLKYAQYGDYHLKAEAIPVPYETDQSDNLLVGETIRLTIPGDVNFDRLVNILDWSSVSAHWYPGPPVGPVGYDSQLDVNLDEAINMIEVSVVSAHWNERW